LRQLGVQPVKNQGATVPEWGSMNLRKTILQPTKNRIVTLAQLSPGNEAIIESFTDEDIKLKLLEMGCLPGEKISVVRLAPLGDPIAVSVSGYLLSLRKDEAATVEVILI
jgi:ferrous iron transport protein A